VAAASLVVMGPAAADVAGGSDPAGGWPLRPQPTVMQGFSPPSTPYGAGNRGVDLLGTASATVYAGLGGRVTFAAPLAGRGVVVIAHGDRRTTYEPVEASVRVGARVRTGDPIGRLETVQSHCFPRACLHWGYLVDDEYRDPLLLIRGPKKVHLKPLS